MVVHLNKILKKGKKLESVILDSSSQKVIEIIRRVHKEQERIRELKYRKFENLEIYILPSYYNYR